MNWVDVTDKLRVWNKCCIWFKECVGTYSVEGWIHKDALDMDKIPIMDKSKERVWGLVSRENINFIEFLEEKK